MRTTRCRLNTVLVGLLFLAFVSTGYGFMTSQEKKVIIHIPDDVTYIKHFHPKVVYIKEKHHGYTTSGGHGIKSFGHSGGRNPLKTLLSSEIHPTEIKPHGWSNSGPHHHSYSSGSNKWPPVKLHGNSPHGVNNGWVESEISLLDLDVSNHDNHNEFPPLNGLGDNTAPGGSLDGGQYGSPATGVSGGFFSGGNQDLGSSFHHGGSPAVEGNGVSSLGPQLFTNSEDHAGSGNNGGFYDEGQSGLGATEGKFNGNYGGSAVLNGQYSGFTQQGQIGNANAWQEVGQGRPSAAVVNPAWQENELSGGPQIASEDWVPVSEQNDNSLWWPMNGENWPQNHASQPQVQNNLHQVSSQPSLGYSTQEGTEGNAFTSAMGNGLQEGLPYASPHTQVQSIGNVGGLAESNIGNYHSNANALTSSVDIPWAWRDQTRPSLVTVGTHGNTNNIIPFQEESYGYATSPANDPNFESAANYYGGSAINNNQGIGASHGALTSNYGNGGSQHGKPSSYGVNSNAYSPAVNNFVSNNHHSGQNVNGYNGHSNIRPHMSTNGNYGGANSYQATHIKNANNIACKRFNALRIKVDSYHPCYEPEHEANQGNYGNSYNINNANRPIGSSYIVPVHNSLTAVSHNAGSNHVSNDINPLNVHGGSDNNYGSGVRENIPQFHGNNVNNYQANAAVTPVYGPVVNDQINAYHQGYAASSSSYSTSPNNINNIQPNNLANNNYGGVVAHGTIGNANCENNEVGTHIVTVGSAVAHTGYYGPTGTLNGATKHIVDTKYTLAKIRPNVNVNGVSGGPYDITSGTSPAPTKYGGVSFTSGPSSPSGSVYYDSNGNQYYNTVGTGANYALSNNPVVSNVAHTSGHTSAGNANGNFAKDVSGYNSISAENYGLVGNSFEVTTNGPFVNAVNLQNYAKPQIDGGGANDAHGSPSSTNIGTLLNYANTNDNNISLRSNDASNNYYVRSGANSVQIQTPPTSYGHQNNNYRSASNTSFSDISSEHGQFVSSPAQNSSYRGNGNSFITSVSYDSSTNKPQYADVPEHRGLPLTTDVGRGPPASGGVTNSGRFTSPIQELDAFNEIIQNSQIYKGLVNVNGANLAPNKYSPSSVNIGINNNNANRGVHSVPSKAQFVTHVQYRQPNTPNKANAVFSLPNRGNVVQNPSISQTQGHVVYGPTISQSQGHVVYGPTISPNRGNVVQNPSISQTQGHVVYGPTTSPNQGNVVYSVPTRSNNGNGIYNSAVNINGGKTTIYSLPNKVNHGKNNIHSLPTSPSFGNNVFNVPNRGSQGSINYRIPIRVNNAYSVSNSGSQGGNSVFRGNKQSNQGNVVYNVPYSRNVANPAYNAPSSPNQGNNNAFRVPNSGHGVPINLHSVPNSVRNVNNIFNVPKGGNQGNAVYNVPVSAGPANNIVYAVPTSASHGNNIAYGVPNSASQGNNIAISVPIRTSQNNNIAFSLPTSASHNAHNVPNSVNNANNIVYNVPNSASHNAHNVPNSVNNANNIVYSVPTSANHNAHNVPNSVNNANNIVYSVPNNVNNAFSIPTIVNTGNNIAYSVPNNPNNGNNIVYSAPNNVNNGNNIVYSVPNSVNNGNNIVYSVPNSASNGNNIAYNVPSNANQGTNVYRGPIAPVIANNPPQSGVFGHAVSYSGEVAYRLPGADTYRNSSGYSVTSGNQGIVSHDNSGNNAAYDSFSSSSGGKHSNVAHAVPNHRFQDASTKFINNVNGLAGSDSNNTNNLAHSGSNINNAYSKPVVENNSNNVFSMTSSINHGNNAYSVSNSVKHINSAFSVDNKGQHETKLTQEASSDKNNIKGTVKRRRLKNGGYKVILPDNGSNEKDIIANIHEEAVRFVETYKIPNGDNFGTGESSDRQWTKRQNVRSMNGVHSDRKSRNNAKLRDYGDQNGYERENNYTPSGPGNLNLSFGSRIPFNGNRPVNGRNYANRSLRHFGNSENHTANDEATRNYVDNNNSDGERNTRKFRGI